MNLKRTCVMKMRPKRRVKKRRKRKKWKLPKKKKKKKLPKKKKKLPPRRRQIPLHRVFSPVSTVLSAIVRFPVPNNWLFTTDPPRTVHAPSSSLRHKRRALKAGVSQQEKKETAAKKETAVKKESKWAFHCLMHRRSQKKQEELRAEIESISGIAEAKLLYGTTEWKEFHLHDALVRNLTQIRCVKPTVIQEKAIEAAFRGKDVLGAAPTGSGKTLAFCVPVIDWLLKHASDEPKEKSEWDVRCIIISPTRELSLQINRVITRLTENTNIR